MDNVKLIAVGLGALVVGMGMGAVYADDSSEVKKLTEDLENAATPEVVTETVEVEVEKVVTIDNADVVLKYFFENKKDNESVRFIMDDLDDDELDQVTGRIAFINEIKDKAVAYAKEEAVDELDKEYLEGNSSLVEFDEDEMERVRVQDDDDEVIVSDIDFEDSDADVMVTVRFEQDDVKYEADFNVEFKDGEVDDFDLLATRLR